jgi:hypothetical protein
MTFSDLMSKVFDDIVDELVQGLGADAGKLGRPGHS